MKRQHTGKKFVFAWIGIYLAVMAIGAAIACGITYYNNRNLPELVRADAVFYEETAAIPEKSKSYGNSIAVCRADGQIEVSFFPLGNAGMYASLITDTARAVAENDTPVFRPALAAFSRNGLVIVTAQPTLLSDGTEGAYIVIKNLSSLRSILIVLFSAITPLCLASAIYSGLIIRKNRETERLQREYVANVSHSLKSPIASIKALTETMYDGLVTDPDKQRKYHGMVLSEANALEHTVQNMMELSKLQASGSRIPTEYVPNLRESLRTVLDKYALLCDELGIRFEVTEAWDKLPPVQTSPERIGEVLDILLSNAVKFVGEDGRIVLDAKAGPRSVAVLVSDNGVGISEEDRKHIFERFYRGSNRKDSSGSGLGLAIAYEILTNLGGTLSVESTPGRGSTFRFTVRRA